MVLARFDGGHRDRPEGTARRPQDPGQQPRSRTFASAAEADPKLRQEWQDAREAQRTTAPYESWLGDRITQVAVTWVLGTVFVRFSEDNDLVELPVIAGPSERTALARDLQQAFFQRYPEKDDRDWLAEGFNRCPSPR